MDYGPRGLQLTISNGSDAALTVTRAAYRSPRFDGSTEWTRPTRIEAGARVNLRILLGTPVCDGDETGVVDLDYQRDDGATGTATLQPGDEFGTLAKVTTQDCIAEKVAAVAGFEMGDSISTEWRGDEFVGLITITGTPTGDTGAVDVTSVSRTILLRPQAGGTGWTLDWTLDARTGALTATLPFEPSNCNPHIVAEDKRGTFFPLEVSASGVTGTVYSGVSDGVRGAIYAYIATYCGW